MRGHQLELRVGYLFSAAQRFLGDAVAQVKQRHPQVRLVLLDQSPAEMIRGLRDGTTDVALIGQEGQVLEADFFVRRIATIPAVVAVPAHTPWAKQKVLSLAELREATFIATPEEAVPGRNQWVRQLCLAAGFKPRFGPLADDDILQLFQQIVTEDAVALLPGYVESLPHPGVVLVPVAEPDATWELLVVWHRGRASVAVPTLVEALAQAAKAWLAKCPAPTAPTPPAEGASPGLPKRRRAVTLSGR